LNRNCPDFEPLLLDRVAGALDDEGSRRLEAHLAGCFACRTEAAAIDRALSLAALPSPSSEELATVAAGAPRAATRWRANQSRRRFAGRLALALVASVVFALAVPWLVLDRRAPVPLPVETALAWEAPDLDAVWAAASIADPGSPDEPMPEVLFAELEEIELDP
jgi:anti-sigma factor RsiW